jgi:hypothetical protein
MKTIFLFFVLTHGVSFAQDCSEVNLITEPNSPFNQIPVYDQSGSGMCYAYAASELMNYELMKSGEATSPVVHPFWAGISQGMMTNDDQLRGGSALESIEGILKRGNCSYESVESAIGALARTVGVTEARIIAFIDDYGRELGKSLQNGRPTPELIRAALSSAAKQNLRGCTYQDWTKIFFEMEKLTGNSIEIADRLLASSCKEGSLQKLNLPKPKSFVSGDDLGMEKNIMEALDQKHPSAMTFCSWVTDRPSSAGLRNVKTDQNNYRVLIDDSPQVCGAHVAVIAGKKMINNQCQFLYYNSMGSGWNSNNRHLTCLCKKRSTGEFVDNCTAKTHGAGAFKVEACWVPAQNLVPNILGVEHY